jgi:hypothetical protein
MRKNMKNLILVICLIFVSVLSIKAQAQPEGWSITQLTDNGYNDAQAQIYGSNIVWSGGSDSHGQEIYLYDGNETIRITDNDYCDGGPQIHGSNIVWVKAGPYPWDYEIFFYDGNTITQLTNNNDYDCSPQIYGSNIVWHGGMEIVDENWDIFFYDGNTTRQIGHISSYNLNPQIYGSNIVWQGKDYDGTSQIFFYDGNSRQRLNDDKDLHVCSPQIYGSNVVWMGSTIAEDSEIYFYDGNTTIQLTDNSYHDIKPQIYGSNVVWQGDDGDDWEIYFYDGNTTTQITDNSCDDWLPQIHGSNIVWCVDDGNDFEIFFYDGNNVIQLTDNNYDDGWPSGLTPQVYGSSVVWAGDYGNDWEIFLATKASPPAKSEVKLTPHMLNCASKGKWVKAHITLPEEVYLEDIDVNTPAVAEPMGVESEYIEVFDNGKGKFGVEIGFDREAFCAAGLESEDGFLDVTVTGWLLTGERFEGTDTIKVISQRWRHREHKRENERVQRSRRGSEKK